MRVQYLLTVNLPNHIYPKDTEKYIRDAVNCYKGGFDPHNPLFDMPRITVKRVDTKIKRIEVG